MKHISFMKHLLCSVTVVLLGIVSFSACQKSEAPYYAHTEQDRDSDVITGDDYEYQLPVIFHVFYQNAQDTLQYVKYNRLKELIAHVNEIYKGSVYIYAGYDQSVDMHVNFVLAEEDENNQRLAQAGVEYVKWTGSWPVDCQTFMGDNKKTYTKYVWDPNEYINVMVYPFKEDDDDTTVTLGISVTPYQGDGYPELEGLTSIKQATLSKTNLKFAYCLSINSNYIYNETSRYKGLSSQTETYNDVAADANATLAHELGHYLGLHHVFAEKNSKRLESCDDTDYCTDTKSYNRVAYETWLQAYVKEKQQETEPSKRFLSVAEMIKRSNDSGDSWNSVNLMDYNVDLNFQFTDQQRQRIRQVLYYSPLIPGPKKERPSSRAAGAASEGELNLPFTLMK